MGNPGAQFHFNRRFPAGKYLSGWASELAFSLIELEHGGFELDMDVVDSIR